MTFPLYYYTLRLRKEPHTPLMVQTVSNASPYLLCIGDPSTARKIALLVDRHVDRYGTWPQATYYPDQPHLIDPSLFGNAHTASGGHSDEMRQVDLQRWTPSDIFAFAYSHGIHALCIGGDHSFVVEYGFDTDHLRGMLETRWKQPDV